VAIRGDHTDGHDHVPEAVARGAVAVVAERPIGGLDPQVAVILVANSRAALAPLAARMFGDPSRRLCVAGVTGTDGKTTTTTMLHAAWQASGIEAAALTTVDFRVGATVTPNRTRQTTLEASDLQAQLRDALERGCTHVALETSSHALVLHRVDEVEYRVAVVLAVTSEHLELHGTREAYMAAKARLVERVAAHPDGLAVLDGDDSYAFARMRSIAVPRRLVVSAAGSAAADLRAEGVVAGPEGVRFLARTPWGDTAVELRLAGRFNAGNALAALAAACATGASLEGAARGLAALERVPGRMERVDRGQPFSVVIDYAHTAESLERVLGELRAATPGRLWAVFGSAGERDRPKRAAMGAVAARLADRVVITDEDPRGEDRLAILDEIAAGARAAGVADDALAVIPARAEAIAFAIDNAIPGDTVLCAGKGHESSIIGSDGPQPWSERAVVEAALDGRAARR
jgi:UDP-N-acetylmuramoyl-L-alanyl-D-glutamate--2,6-diaminopimelate ligase